MVRKKGSLNVENVEIHRVRRGSGAGGGAGRRCSADPRPSERPAATQPVLPPSPWLLPRGLAPASLSIDMITRSLGMDAAVSQPVGGLEEEFQICALGRFFFVFLTAAFFATLVLWYFYS